MKRLLTLLVAATSFAASTTTWEMNSYQDFVKGRFDGVSLARDGRLALAPRLETLFSSDQPVVWAMVQSADGAVYAATGHRGRVFRIPRGGAAAAYWTADEPEVFALALDAAGALYAAASPDGKIYRIVNGKAEEYFAPKAKYIWSLAFGRDGALYAGTGDQGKVFRIEAAGRGEVYYETGQSHVTSLAFDASGRVLAGSEPNGILYRISAKDKGFALYDANLPEIRAILPAADGTIYAAALGGSMAKRTQGAGQAGQPGGAAPVVQGPVTTITVTAEAANAAELKPPDPSKPAPGQQPAQAQAAPPPAAALPAMDIPGVERSALYRINPDNTVDTLWSSKEENIYDLARRGDDMYFSTDSSGRVYRLSTDRKVTLVAQTNEAEATRLLAASGGLLAATGNIGKIYRLGDERTAAGTYESPVHDAGTVARWGRMAWRTDGPPASAGLRFRTRSGNSLRPDATWSEWSAPLVQPAGVASPNARFIQWKAELSGDSAIDSVTLTYLPQNTPPSVKSLTVTTQLAPIQQKPTAAANPTAAFSVTVTDTGDATTSASAGTPTQPAGRASSQQLTISWQTEDPDGDRMVFKLDYRAEDERQWKTLKSAFHDQAYLMDADALPDGRYFFRVTASDREANSPASAREDELVSAPVLIDNTPPRVTAGAPRRNGRALEVDIEASDDASPLRRCEYSIDAGAWTPLDASDGVIDSQREAFRLRHENLAPGEHVIAIRAVDSANNSGLGKVVVTGPRP